jgi:hypothetical protein
MGLFDFNPVDWFESAVNGKLEREAANALLSAAFSAQINFLWSVPLQCCKDAATAIYLSLQGLETKNFLRLTINQQLRDPANLSRFITEEKTK